MREFLTLSPLDNVEVALTGEAGIPFGHKAALCDIGKGEPVVKYGFPIGVATCAIKKGEHVHTHNLKSQLAGEEEYVFQGAYAYRQENPGGSFLGYRHAGGKVGIRNDIWVIPTVGCINALAVQAAKQAERLYGIRVLPLCHPYGCSQMGDDQLHTQKILAALAGHPNAGGVLVLSLGCENNNLASFTPLLSGCESGRLRFVVAQNETDELQAALAAIGQLAELAAADKREEIPLNELIIGFKCGGSDAFSGITANPLCGCLADLHTSRGGRAVLTEVPEMFGAEKLLLARATGRDVFERAVRMLNHFKRYYLDHGQVVYENPSPGNKEGGITTLEEKSLGCVQKGGTAPVTDVLDYAQACVKPGLSLLTGPGNDIVSCTNLAASGAHIILFTTGRGTPFGTVVPTLKIASGAKLARAKPGWVDYDASPILEGTPPATAAQALLALVQDTASGKPAQNEQNGYAEIAIFKNGITL